MKVLCLLTEKNKEYQKLKQAFHEQGLKVGYVNLKRISLHASTGRTRIVHPDIDLANYDAVYLAPALLLAPFIEPLLEELHDLGKYVQFRPGSFYTNSNEPMQLITLNSFNLKVPKTVLLGRARKIMSASKNLEYPLLFKIYRQHRKSLSLLVESSRSLRSLSKSLDTEVDGLLLREFIDADQEQCLVIGDSVKAIQRRWINDELEKLERGIITKLSKPDMETAVQAARACGCDIAVVKLCRGYVTHVDPAVKLSVFNKKIGTDFYAEIAKHYKEQIQERSVRSKINNPIANVE